MLSSGVGGIGAVGVTATIGGLQAHKVDAMRTGARWDIEGSREDGTHGQSTRKEIEDTEYTAL